MKLYSALGVSRDSSADEIRKAYKKLVVQHHPDKGGDPEKFKEISSAYEVLSDDNKRARYDQVGDAGFDGGGGGGGHPGHPGGFPGGMNPHDIFQQMFGGGGGGGGGFNFSMGGGPGGGGQAPENVRRSDNIHQIHISLAEAYNGLKKTVKITLNKTCCRCKVVCHDCQGRGTITELHRAGIFTQMINRQCGKCNGAGKVTQIKQDCSECKGKANYSEEKKEEIDIPKCVSSGHQICLIGLGEQIQCMGETPGNLILQIIIDEDKNFTRQGNDLVYKHIITFAQSVIGKTVTVPHFGGEIAVNTEKYGVIEPGKNYIVNGKGMNANSNLILVFTVKYPEKSWNADEKKTLVDAFAKINLIAAPAS